LHKIRLQLILILTVLTPLGFYTKFYTGPLNNWVNNSLGGLLYLLFWCFVALFIFPKARAVTVAAGVFSITCLLEFLQLWHPQVLQAIRGTFIGKTVLGTSFVWSDFFYYIVGSLLGYFFIRILNKQHL